MEPTRAPERIWRSGLKFSNSRSTTELSRTSEATFDDVHEFRHRGLLEARARAKTRPSVNRLHVIGLLGFFDFLVRGHPYDRSG